MLLLLLTDLTTRASHLDIERDADRVADDGAAPCEDAAVDETELTAIDSSTWRTVRRQGPAPATRLSEQRLSESRWPYSSSKREKPANGMPGPAFSSTAETSGFNREAADSNESRKRFTFFGI